MILKKSILSVVLCLCMILGSVQVMADDKSTKPAALPEKAAAVTGVNVKKNDKAAVDASNLTEGYVLVSYTGKKNVRIKVQITKSGGTTYTYNLNNKGTVETFPLTEGDGTYKVSVFENITGTKYSQAYSCSIDVKLRNNFLPFLYPNQYVNFTSTSKTAQKAAELSKGTTTEVELVQAVYDYVIKNISYDYDLAATVQSGYLPVVDDVLAAGKGICFDYAALMSAMLRSQNLPCKLVVGYHGTVYHAWINVYLDEIGWVDSMIYFDGTSWKMMDPTFAASAGNNPETLKKYVGDGTKYTAKYAY